MIFLEDITDEFKHHPIAIHCYFPTFFLMAIIDSLITTIDSLIITIGCKYRSTTIQSPIPSLTKILRAFHSISEASN